MINIKFAKRYCVDYTQIENYDKAIADNTQMWHCHHKLELCYPDGTFRPVNARLSRADLQTQGKYYGVQPEELIFLTSYEHRSLHNKGKKYSEATRQKIAEASRGNKNCLGHKPSEETRKKISEANKGKSSLYKGIPRSEEVRKKISEKLKGRQMPDDVKRRISEAHKRRLQLKQQEINNVSR